MDRDCFFDRYAVSTFLYRKQPLEEGLRRIAGAGFRWVELWADNGHLDPRLGPVDLKAVRSLLDDLGLQAHSLHTPFNGVHLGQPPSYDAGFARQVIGEAIRQAGFLGARLAVVHPTSDPQELPPELWPASRHLAQDLVAEMMEAAEEAGTQVALENTVRRRFYRYGTSLAELATDFPDPRVGFCLDVGHAMLNGTDIAAEARAAGSRLISIHVANNDGQHDSHFPPNQGVIDWPRTVAILHDAGYISRFVLETDAHGDADAMLNRLKDLWHAL